MASGPEAARAVPSSLRRRSARGGAVATPTRPSSSTAVPGSGPAGFGALGAITGAPPDTLLPGALPRPDNLLPRATRPNPPHVAQRRAPGAGTRVPAARRGRFTVPTVDRAAIAGLARDHWRRIVVVVVVGVALTVSGIEAWPVVFSGGASSTATNLAPDARATSLLRTVVGGGRMIYSEHRSYAGATTAELSTHSYKVSIVGPTTVAHVGQVSMRATNAVLTVATPADSARCVFARDTPAKSLTQFATVTTADCRAAAAPATGWSAR